VELTEKIARDFARTALGHVAREYPHKLDHVMSADEDVLPPRVLHPCFFGSFDWHSCVHGWWTLLSLRRLYPAMPEAAEISALAEETFTQEKLDQELAYLSRPGSAGFERPYGWGWLLYLHLEAARHDDRDWGERLRPLAEAFAKRFHQYLLILTYPIRTGTHFNSAFALTLAMEWADRFDPDLAATIREKAVAWFTDDQNAQAWEPGGDEFLSPTLSTALLMQLALGPERFPRWFTGLLPELSLGLPKTLFKPVHVSFRADGKIAHLDGLNLSRAWAWRKIAAGLPVEYPIVDQAAEAHLVSAMPHVTGGEYAGEHWLASFALLALLAAE